LINKTPNSSADEVWEVTGMGTNHEIAVIAFFDNGHHLCSCRKLARQGILCVHFFAVLQRSHTPKFHIGLLPSRWYKDSALNEDLSNCAVICAEGEIQDTSASIFLTAIKQRWSNSIEQDLQQQRSKVQKFGEVWGKSREASLLSIELNDNQLNRFLTKLIAELREEKSKRAAANTNEVCFLFHLCICLFVKLIYYNEIS
jgi:hypothetical protein